MFILSVFFSWFYAESQFLRAVDREGGSYNGPYGHRPVPDWARPIEAIFGPATRFEGVEHAFVVSDSITDDDLRDIGQLHRMKSLELASSQISDKGVEYLSSLGELEMLVLQSDSMTDEALHHISRMPKIRLLSVRSKRIKGHGVASLVRARELEAVALICPHLTVDDIRPLSKLPQLESLNVGGTRVDRSLIEILDDFPQLRDLCVDGTLFEEDDVDELRSRYPRLNVYNNPESLLPRRTLNEGPHLSNF